MNTSLNPLRRIMMSSESENLMERFDSCPVFERSVEVLTRLLATERYGLRRQEITIVDASGITHDLTHRIRLKGYKVIHLEGMGAPLDSIDVMIYYGSGKEDIKSVETKLSRYNCNHMILMNVMNDVNLIPEIKQIKLYSIDRFRRYPYQIYTIKKWYDFIYGIEKYSRLRSCPVVRIKWILKKENKIKTSLSL